MEHYGAGEAYLPVLEALGQLCRQAGGERVVALLSRYAPTWLVQMPALVSDVELEALGRKVQGATRERMLREMAEALEALTAERALVLVDSRHGLKDVDRDIMKMLDDAAVSYHLVLTKADKVKPTELARTIEAIRTEAATHPAAHPLILPTSSETGAGIAELRTAMLEAILS